MTNNKLTEEVLQGIYTVAVSGEIAEKNEEPMSAFDLLCAADAAGGIAHLVRKLIDELRADRAELQERRKADSEPVVFTDERNLHHIAMGRETSLIWGKQNSEAGDVPLYRHAQPVVPILTRADFENWCQKRFAPSLSYFEKDANGVYTSTLVHDLYVAWEGYRAAMLAAADCSIPMISDRWIPVSERMPEGSEEVLCAKEFDGPGDWRKKVGYLLAGKWTVYGASWAPTHWMPLPNSPQEAK